MTATDGKPILRIRGLEAGYGDVQVLWGIDMDVPGGEIACVVGSNGAGKSTLLRTVSGMVTPTAGRIEFGGQPIGGASCEAILRAGIAHVPEGRRLFKGLSVLDNLLLGAYSRNGKADIQRDLQEVFRLFLILEERQDQDATTLSGGQQQMCAIGRGLMSRPSLLMIDELSLGLAPRAVEQLCDSLREINRRGVTILLVEQDVQTAFELAGSGVVIETGRVGFAGRSEALADDPRVRAAYMGF